jgi:hypothetical protein
MKKLLIILVGISCLMLLGTESYGQFWKRKKKTEKTDTVKKKSEYDKLFKDKKYDTYKGLITVYKFKKDNKLFFEFPLKMLNRDMLLASTVSQISDNGDCIVGAKPHSPIHIKWTLDENYLQLRQVNTSCVNSDDNNIQKALNKSNISAVYKNFSIKAYNSDSTAVVVDVTEFFKDDNKDIDPFDPYSANCWFGFVARRTKYKKDESLITNVKAFSDNVCVLSDLTYTVDLAALGMFYIQVGKHVTAKVARSIILLPEEPMKPRFGDPRIGVFYSQKNNFTSKEDELKTTYYANHWRLEPKNEIEWKKGKLVEPKKPIVFYVDDAYPEAWKKYIKQGVEDWQSAFEKIGFKNAIIAKDFPTKEEDSEFDPDNIKYSCLRYAPIWSANSMGPSWTDPRSGEIINASVYSFHNIAQLIRDWRFIQTAQVDKKVRTKKLDEKTFGESIRYVIAHEIGHCLGLMHNMSASAAIPTDSLRSAKFTQKYGTTYSIMDYARFNYVAQPGDKGLKLTPPKIGIYDDLVIKYLYTPILGANTPEEEVKTLRKWISEKAGNKIFRYGKQQVYSILDPSSQTEDIGDDAIKSSEYGIKNLKYIIKHANEWVADEDIDRSFRDNILIQMSMQYKRYIDHVAANIGGIYLNETFEGDPLPTYQSVSKEKQIRALKFLLKQVKDVDWFEDNDLFHNVTIGRSKTYSRAMAKNLFSTIMGRLYSLDKNNFRCKNSKNIFTKKEYLNLVYNFVWESTKRGKNPTKTEMNLQQEFLSGILGSCGLKAGKGGVKLGIADNEFKLPEFISNEIVKRYGVNELYIDKIEAIKLNTNKPVQGFTFDRPLTDDNLNCEATFYEFVLKTKSLLERVKNTGTITTRSHYRLLLHKINKILE